MARGPALADEEAMSVLTALCLVGDDSHWTEQAELVLWRRAPRKWDLQITSGLRILRAMRNAADDIPSGIRAEIGRLVTITDEDIKAEMPARENAEEWSAKSAGCTDQAGAGCKWSTLETLRRTGLGLLPPVANARGVAYV